MKAVETKCDNVGRSARIECQASRVSHAMRDPWFPLLILLIVLVAIWLGVVGPLPGGFADWLHRWQTLAAAGVASIAAYVAFQNTSRTLHHGERLERQRRDRKHAAVRAVLPLALSSLSQYAQESAEALGNLVDKCDGETLPRLTATEELIRPLPSDTLKTLTDFIEYTDHGDVRIMEALIAAIQVHDARLRGIYSINNDPSIVGVVIRADLEGRIVDAASIYAGANAFYDYARRRSNELPISVPWQNVAVALSNMRLWDSEYPRVYEAFERQRSFSTGPFDIPSEGT